LSLVAAICVATRPLSIADPAFVLTCGATLGILLSQQSPLDPAESRRGGRLASSASSALHTALRSMFVASVAAEMVLLPIGALLFSRVTVAGLALNFLAIPLMATAQVAGMAVVPLTVASEPFAALAGAVAHAGATGLVWSADLVRFAPSTSWRVASPAWAILAWYYLAGIVGWSLWRRRAANLGSAESLLAGYLRRIAWAVTACAALAIVADPKAVLAARGDGRLHVTFLDVGQGDSALVRFPRGQTMLVDAGGVAGPSRFDIGDRVVGAFLRHSRVRHLDYVVLTHGDLDHVDGAEAILRDFRPSEVWEGIPVLPFGPLTALRAQAAASGSRWANVYRGDRLLIDGVEVVALHPEPGDWERQRVRNDDSIVLDIRWGDVSVLLTGDIGREVERAIDTAPARLRVLKVPHHGSLTSSSAEFVRAMDPKVAVFSAGRANAFGHPAPAVLQRYRAAGAAIFRTDQDGAVSLTTDGHSIDVSTFTGRRLKLPAMAYHEVTKNTKDREERIHDNAQNRLHAAP
jgi:competence protein ComEC